MLQNIFKNCRSIGCFCLITTLSGCASNTTMKEANDPLEGYNRAMHQFNDTLDRYIVKPVAKGYKNITPNMVQTGINNFFSNLDDVTVIVNNLLQGKLNNTASDTGRLVINTTAGIAGIIDVATELNLKKHNEDFGQTLGYWGIGTGPYIVWPFLGPSDVRDSVGRVVDWTTDPLNYVENETIQYSLEAVKIIDKRANLLDASKIVDEAALDPYEFIRDGYLQRRQYLVYDGVPPDMDIDNMDDEDFDDMDETTDKN